MSKSVDLVSREPRGVIKGARRLTGETQAEFALRVDSSQSLISRYESGEVDPPAQVLMQCVNILDASFSANVTLDALLILIRDRLRGASMTVARTALAQLVLSLAPDNGEEAPGYSIRRAGKTAAKRAR